MSARLEAAPGDVVSETTHATTYKGATAATFEGKATLANVNSSRALFSGWSDEEDISPADVRKPIAGHSVPHIST